MKTISIPIAILLMLVFMGCGASTDQVQTGGAQTNSANTISTNGQSPSTSGDTPANQLPADANRTVPAVLQKGKVEFRVGEGTEVFSLQPKDATSCKLYDASGKELCKLTFVGEKLKVKTADDKPLFELKPKADKVMIKDATGENELFKFKLKGDTIDFYLPGDKRVNRIKKQDYGWRLEDNQDQTLFRSKAKDGKLVLRNINDQTVLYTNDFENPLAILFFRIEQLSFEQQAACCVFFLDK